MKLQSWDLHQRGVSLSPHGAGPVTRLQMKRPRHLTAKARLDAMNRHHLFAQGHIDGRFTMVRRRVHAVEQMDRQRETLVSLLDKIKVFSCFPGIPNTNIIWRASSSFASCWAWASSCRPLSLW